MGPVALALDLTPLARLKVHLDQDQLVHWLSSRIMHLLLVHHNLVRRVISIWTNHCSIGREKGNIVLVSTSKPRISKAL